ncbi:CDP-alcohol phosphatidyltransferase family protein [Hyphomonas pacifica]|uniref:CDP-diacylglycerol--glycerol-3-phosphate 3-phosphatidyltransferase n=1 Tax=Hyphomonas pacifica TaxID=1280941 RepID=A0A062TXZ9_9PROT|nr:CDP-alcohol phosphatidyltransferase family protein [Hyphomonas pacifica]KCZ52946.1 hypothetical protein HY2_00040 [Hyphomonas pacifica]RAN36195.1 hypothetical protein HY3_01030 [Hyphomonas pacifica]RAN37791.1 hypothetical protein HY11_07865 [Hyphomonas pacifica]
MNLKWLPNALTIARCVFAGLLLLGFWQALSLDPAEAGLSADDSVVRATLQQLWYQFAFLAFLSGALTDFLDGWLARQLNAHSRFGVWLDPIADKLLIAAALICLSIQFRSWLIYIPAAMIIARDVFITWFRATPKGKAVIVPSNMAKWKTGFEMAAIIGMMLPLAVLAPDPQRLQGEELSLAVLAIVFALVGLLWVAAILSWQTAWQYMKAALRPQG